jgi:hypothetical protein
MGGKGSGGPRVGAGRRAKSDALHLVDGTESRARVIPHPNAAVPEPIERFDAPAPSRIRPRVPSGASSRRMRSRRGR